MGGHSCERTAARHELKGGVHVNRAGNDMRCILALADAGHCRRLNTALAQCASNGDRRRRKGRLGVLRLAQLLLGAVHAHVEDIKPANRLDLLEVVRTPGSAADEVNSHSDDFRCVSGTQKGDLAHRFS